MDGETVYAIYCESAAHLPKEITRGEALPAWAFLLPEQQRMWVRVAARLDKWLPE